MHKIKETRSTIIGVTGVTQMQQTTALAMWLNGETKSNWQKTTGNKTVMEPAKEITGQKETWYTSEIKNESK